MRTSLPPAARHARLGSAAALTVLAAALAGCGTSASPGSAAGATSSGPAPTSVAPSPAPSVIPPAPGTPTIPAPTRPTRPAHGNGDADAVREPAAAGGGVCAELSEAEIGTALGGGVDGTALPGGGCGFEQSRPARPAATVIESSFSKVPDGMDGAKADATSSVEGTPTDVPGTGDQAFVVTGTAFGGEDVQGAGAVRVGDRLVEVTLTQSSGLTAPQVRARLLALLRLVAGELA